MSTLDRRSFLAQAGAMPLLLGLGDERPEEVLDRALARMKAMGRWGVVLVPPPAGQERALLGRGLWAIGAFDNEDEDAHLLLCQTVFAALPDEFVRKRFAVAPGTTRLLLSPEGKVLAADVEPLSVVLDPAKFVASFRPFVHGPSNARLMERAREIESRLEPELRAALGKLGSTQDVERLQAQTALVPRLEGITPLLGRLAETGSGELERRRARNLLTSYFASLKEEARVPFGCSGPHHWDPCPGCGMGRVPERSRMFLRFLGDPVPRRGE